MSAISGEGKVSKSGESQSQANHIFNPNEPTNATTTLIQQTIAPVINEGLNKSDSQHNPLQSHEAINVTDDVNKLTRDALKQAKGEKQEQIPLEQKWYLATLDRTMKANENTAMDYKKCFKKETIILSLKIIAIAALVTLAVAAFVAPALFLPLMPLIAVGLILLISAAAMVKNIVDDLRYRQRTDLNGLTKQDEMLDFCNLYNQMTVEDKMEYLKAVENYKKTRNISASCLDLASNPYTYKQIYPGSKFSVKYGYLS